MSKPPVKLHMGEQHAAALLAPIQRDLSRTEARLQNYLDRLKLSEADTARITHARDAVAAGAATLADLEAEARS